MSDPFALVSPDNVADTKDEFRKQQAERSLYEFIRQMWPRMDPAPFVDGWHIRVICEHLEAVCRAFGFLEKRINQRRAPLPVAPSFMEDSVWEEQFSGEDHSGWIEHSIW